MIFPKVKKKKEDNKRLKVKVSKMKLAKMQLIKNATNKFTKSNL